MDNKKYILNFGMNQCKQRITTIKGIFNKPFTRWYKMEDKQVMVEYGEQDLKEILSEYIKQAFIETLNQKEI